MKKIIVTLVFVLYASTLFAQYKMSIQKADNTTEDIWVHDITEITFTNVPFTCGTNTITYAGQIYNTVLIGSQCWLKENLNVGTMINSTTAADSQLNNGIIEKYCYSNNEANCTTYGGLYQWKEAMAYSTTPGTKGICPTGWHIPTAAEFQTLFTTVSNNSNGLKAVGQGTGSGAGTNTSGFSALLAGYRDPDGTFRHLDLYADFWSSTQYNSDYAYGVTLNDYDSNIDMHDYFKYAGFSVRCLKD